MKIDIKNLCVFSLDIDEGLLASLPAALAEHPACDPTGGEEARAGFAPPLALMPDSFVRRLGDYLIFKVEVRKRVLPGVVVASEVSKRVQDIVASEGRPVGGKERRQIKSDAKATLLPRAFIAPQSIEGWIDRKGWLVVNTSSVKAAEMVGSSLRDALGTLPMQPLHLDGAGRILDRWLHDGSAVTPFELGDSCVLSDKAVGGTWTGRKVPLDGEEVREHLNASAVPTRLGLIYKERVEFVFGDDGVIRKFALTDVAAEPIAHDEFEGGDAEFDAIHSLVCAEADHLVRDIHRTFCGGDA